ncbi:MAG TPA: hypothetical protein VHQ66_10200 [Myxococcota bacterium]|jgi:hypothetical protein|nr:hypothetical protein [Myxococcota bacterium]
MRRLALSLLLVLALPAAAGDLIRFRAKDGTLGMVDHPSKLPPGARVIDQRAATVSKPDPEPAAAPAPAPPSSSGRGLGRDTPAPFASVPASPGESGVDSGMWCDRGHRAHEAIEEAQRWVEVDTERLDECNDSPRRDCDWLERQLEGRERTLERAERRLADLEAECRDAGCLPGWIRGDCR